MADRVIGITDLVKAFDNLSKDMKLKSAPRIVMAGARVVRASAKKAAQQAGLRKSGALINNIAVKRERAAPEGTAQVHVGVRHGRDLGNGKKVIKFLAVNKQGRVVTRRQNDPFYWRFLNFGTRHIRAFHFMEAGLSDGGKAALAAMEKQAEKDLAKGQNK